LSDVETVEIKDEELFYFLNNLVGVIENKKIVRIWGTQRDLTPQKKAEKELAKSRKQHDFALAAGSVGTFVWNFITNKITWTKIQSGLYGMEEDSFDGNIETWFNFLHPDDVEYVKQAAKESVENNKDLAIEFRILWPDKSLHWIMCRANIFSDKEGKAIEMSGVNIDITERKLKEQIKEENEERFRALVQNSFDVITVFDNDGTITYQSDSLKRVLGYDAESRIGKNIFKDSIVHPDDLEIEKNLFQKCIETPYVYIRSEFRMKHNEDDYKIMEVGCINLANNSSIHGIIQFYRDVTERRMLEKQKEEFIGVASHELKTPVTSIKAYTQILYEIFKEKEDEYSADLLLKMEGQIDRLTTLIKDLLDVTKITEGQLTLKREEYDINELIKEVAGEMQVTTKKHKITLNLSKIPTVFGDRNKTSQVIINLLSNAIKYSPEANQVIISTKGSENEVTVCVQDFGIGITNEMQKKLFNRFFRVSDEVASTFSGLGLGLFISSEIVKNQNGHIWVESTPKAGATFCFSLPYK